MPRRSSHSDALMRSAVAAAFLLTISLPGTYRSPIGAVSAISRYNTPATRASLLVRLMSIIVLALGDWPDGRVHHAADRLHEVGPARLFAQELFLSFGRESIELRPLVRVGLPPLRRDPPFLGEPLEGGIEGTGFDLQDL